MPEMETNSDPHYFDFDLDRGIREQVGEKLESMREEEEGGIFFEKEDEEEEC